jgi:plasmid stabilization system protein ParE
MKLPVDFRREAQRDFDDAIDWYEKQRRGLGSRFSQAVQRELDKIAENPLVRGFVYSEVRCGLVRRFPYGVYYRVKLGRIEIIAILHGRRDPTVWQVRLDG